MLLPEKYAYIAVMDSHLDADFFIVHVRTVSFVLHLMEHALLLQLSPRTTQLGAEGVSPEDDVILVIAPQPIAGYSVHELLVETTEAAADRPVVLLNPNLKDRPSSAGVMQVRGRGDRIAFAQSFKDVYNYRMLYASSVAFFPIKVSTNRSSARSRSRRPWETISFVLRRAVNYQRRHFGLSLMRRRY